MPGKEIVKEANQGLIYQAREVVCQHMIEGALRNLGEERFEVLRQIERLG
jgi:DNA-binding GntR family transcriptional regulator